MRSLRDISPPFTDGSSYAYSYERVECSDLFVVDGLG